MYKIAIIDDETEILKILERFLQKDFQVKTFTNPLNGYQEVVQGHFDLLLCDIMMPQLNGLELLKKLRDNNCDTKVIMMTAFDSLDKALQAHTYGAKNYIKKPFKSLDSITTLILQELQN
ncbi:MAG: response regulator [Arcobacteraceae bacterium]|jgi:DNA-binding NtrC family response regulator|nr:response regulator [Arcobacteraceae bacterium]